MSSLKEPEVEKIRKVLNEWPVLQLFQFFLGGRYPDQQLFKTQVQLKGSWWWYRKNSDVAQVTWWLLLPLTRPLCAYENTLSLKRNLHCLIKRKELGDWKDNIRAKDPQKFTWFYLSPFLTSKTIVALLIHNVVMTEMFCLIKFNLTDAQCRFPPHCCLSIGVLNMMKANTSSLVGIWELWSSVRQRPGFHKQYWLLLCSVGRRCHQSTCPIVNEKVFLPYPSMLCSLAENSLLHLLVNLTYIWRT